MASGVPAHSHVRPADQAVRSALRDVAQRSETRGDIAPLQLAVIGNHPYYVVKLDDDEEEWWFDALTGARVAGPS